MQLYYNCDGEMIIIYNSNIFVQIYIYIDNDYFGCIVYVNSGCVVEMLECVMCFDVIKLEFILNNGYDYGDVIFIQIVGVINVGYMNLVVECINWIICNGEFSGYFCVMVNQVIWYIIGIWNIVNQLVNDVIVVVINSNFIGVVNNMVFYIFNYFNIQFFVDYYCFIVFNGDCSVIIRVCGNCGGEQM